MVVYSVHTVFSLWQVLAGGAVDADGSGGVGGLHVQGLHGGPLPTPGHCWSHYRFVCRKKKNKTKTQTIILCGSLKVLKVAFTCKLGILSQALQTLLTV